MYYCSTTQQKLFGFFCLFFVFLLKTWMEDMRGQLSKKTNLSVSFSFSFFAEIEMLRSSAGSLIKWYQKNHSVLLNEGSSE